VTRTRACGPEFQWLLLRDFVRVRLQGASRIERQTGIPRHELDCTLYRFSLWSPEELMGVLTVSRGLTGKGSVAEGVRRSRRDIRTPPTNNGMDPRQQRQLDENSASALQFGQTFSIDLDEYKRDSPKRVHVSFAGKPGTAGVIRSILEAQARTSLAREPTLS